MMPTSPLTVPVSRIVSLPSGRKLGIAELGPGATRHISKESRGITTLVRYAPWALKLSFALLEWRMRRNPTGLVEDQVRHLPPIDQGTLADPLLRRMLIDTIGEAFRRGILGVYEDTLVVARPWGFAPETIATPTWIWQGDADTSVLPALADELAKKLPNCHASSFAGEGYFMVFTHWQAIVQTLTLAFRRVSAP